MKRFLIMLVTLSLFSGSALLFAVDQTTAGPNADTKTASSHHKKHAGKAHKGGHKSHKTAAQTPAAGEVK